MDAAKAARQKGDTVAFRSNAEKAHQLMQNASFRTQEQAEIRAILTPDQQAKFDARAKQRAEGGHKGWGHKGKGDKPETK
jgi:Spy/CpxP family protein refolding chaperone